jgi:hypothetical protein
MPSARASALYSAVFLTAALGLTATPAPGQLRPASPIAEPPPVVLPALFEAPQGATGTRLPQHEASAPGRPDVMIAGGLTGMLLGMLVGAGAGALLGQRVFSNCGDYCGGGALPGGFLGALVGQPVGLAFGVHFANDEQGSLGTDTLLSVGTAGIGLALATAVPDDMPPMLLLAIPIAQLALVIGAECRVTAEGCR